LNFISEIATVKYSGLIQKFAPINKTANINAKKLPLKFNIFVRVEMTDLKRQKLLC